MRSSSDPPATAPSRHAVAPAPPEAEVKPRSRRHEHTKREIVTPPRRSSPSWAQERVRGCVGGCVRGSYLAAKLGELELGREVGLACRVHAYHRRCHETAEHELLTVVATSLRNGTPPHSVTPARHHMQCTLQRFYIAASPTRHKSAKHSHSDAAAVCNLQAHTRREGCLDSGCPHNGAAMVCVGATNIAGSMYRTPRKFS